MAEEKNEKEAVEDGKYCDETQKEPETHLVRIQTKLFWSMTSLLEHHLFRTWLEDGGWLRKIRR